MFAKIKYWYLILFTNVVFALPPILTGREQASSSESEGTYGGFTMNDGKIELNPYQGVETGTGTEAINKSFTALKTILGALRGIGTIVCVICLVYGAIQFAMAAGNPQNATKAKQRMKTSLIGTALIGGATVIFSLFYNIV